MNLLFPVYHGNQESDMVSGEAWWSESGQMNSFQETQGHLRGSRISIPWLRSDGSQDPRWLRVPTTQGIVEMSHFLSSLIGAILMRFTAWWQNCCVTGAKPPGWVLRSTLLILNLVMGWVVLHLCFLVSVSHDNTRKNVLGWNYDSWKKTNVCGVCGRKASSLK